MKRIIAIGGLVVACGCSLGLTDRYPSYDAAVARVNGLPATAAVRVQDGNVPVDPWCDCPRVFYHNTWVYYYSGRWIYWADDCWYTYPALSVYHVEGVPFASEDPTRSIRKGEPRHVRPSGSRSVHKRK